MFADQYLIKQNRKQLIEIRPDQNLGISIVIPCFREPEIHKTLHSLHQCDPPKSQVEVLILINHSETADAETKRFNRITKAELENWIRQNGKSWLQYFAMGPVELKKKWAGAGIARKTGMDEAIRRFNLIEKPDGIIISLDADTLVDKNYLLEIEKHFKVNRKNIATTISFEHQKEGLNEKHLEGIRLYEKFMKYYKAALGFTGYPFAMFTVGSAFAVTAEAYVKRGGMNRRQAGEDFYFLQGLTRFGEVGEILTTKVYPSARLSNRVPFGTGPILKKWMDGEEDLTKTYNFQAFQDLRIFFEVREKLFNLNKDQFHQMMKTIPEPVSEFIINDNFWLELEDLNNNCSTLKMFHKRFWQKFNAFKILKFLNFSHEHFYDKGDLEKQIQLFGEAN